MIYAREFFDLQVSFAERVRDLSGLSLERALLRYTNLYVRLGFGRDFDDGHPGWRAYVAGLRDAADVREWTYGCYLQDPEATTAPPLVASFGCFSYGLSRAGEVRLHFRNADGSGASPLGLARVAHRRAELAELFRHVKGAVCVDALVVGVSWLYNLAAYRRLFPPSYARAARVVRDKFRSMPLWGQLVDRDGRVRDSMRDPFLARLARAEDLDGLERCFRFPVLTTRAAVREFCDFYGV